MTKLSHECDLEALAAEKFSEVTRDQAQLRENAKTAEPEIPVNESASKDVSSNVATKKVSLNLEDPNKTVVIGANLPTK